MWKKKPDNWPKVNKEPEELPYINDLNASLLLSSLGGMPTHFLSGCASVPCLSSLNKLFLCVLSHLLCCVSNNKLCTCFCSFCLLEKCIFQWRQGPGEFSFQPLAPGGLMARIPGFHPGYPGPIPGQRTKILLQATARCCLSKIGKTQIYQIRTQNQAKQDDWPRKTRRNAP